MDRRTALTCLAGAATGLAGCSFPFGGASSGGGHETPPPPAEDPEREVAETVPDARTFQPAATAANGLTLEALDWQATDRVRYSPDGESGFEFYEPDGWVVTYDFALANEGDESLDAVSDFAFVLRVDGAEVDHLHDLGEGISFSQVNQPEGEPEIERLSWYRELAPGDRTELQLVYEVDARPEAPVYLVWYHDGEVEGAAAPAYVRPEA